MRTEIVPLDTVIPYWRNPRRITDEAVNAVAESLRKFGYQQPIVVGPDMVIIVGHTRYAAARRLGYTDIEVSVVDDLSPQEIKQLRLIDNKTAEMTSWDFESLTAEMEGLDKALMSRFFPDIAEKVFDVVEGDAARVSNETQLWVNPPVEEEKAELVEFICPSCFHQWEQPVHREDVFAGVLRSAAEEAS